jgi:hypothetical protein
MVGCSAMTTGGHSLVVGLRGVIVAPAGRSASRQG